MRKLLSILLIVAAVLSLVGVAFADYNGKVTFDVELKDAAKAKKAELWLPYPLSDANQTITNVDIKANGAKIGVESDPKSGAVYLHATWRRPKKLPKLTMSFNVNSHYSKNTRLRETNDAFPPEVRKYLEATPSLPIDQGFCAEASMEFINKPTVLEKAQGIYRWVLENTFRDESVKEGCGLGLPIRTISEKDGGGKCADISSVFVALARASGIPTRDVYGLRVDPAKSGEITGNYHCWTEFYLPGTGWVMADPADVRKKMLNENIESVDDAKKWSDFFWGGDDLFRIALNRDTRETVLSEATAETPLTYFMYPYAEIDGKVVDWFSPKTFEFKLNLELY
ncbi:MAG: transglutaminase family protein [Synergistaceae bacterium]|nr:transglutaminase family protein [Synergistaceae bacterium]